MQAFQIAEHIHRMMPPAATAMAAANAYRRLSESMRNQMATAAGKSRN